MQAQVLSARDVSRLSRRRMSTVLEWLASGQLPAERSGNRWFVQAAALEAFLRDRAIAETEARRQAATPA